MYGQLLYLRMVYEPPPQPPTFIFLINDYPAHVQAPCRNSVTTDLDKIDFKGLPRLVKIILRFDRRQRLFTPNQILPYPLRDGTRYTSRRRARYGAQGRTCPCRTVANEPVELVSGAV